MKSYTYTPTRIQEFLEARMDATWDEHAETSECVNLWLSAEGYPKTFRGLLRFHVDSVRDAVEMLAEFRDVPALKYVGVEVGALARRASFPARARVWGAIYRRVI